MLKAINTWLSECTMTWESKDRPQRKIELNCFNGDKYPWNNHCAFHQLTRILTYYWREMSRLYNQTCHRGIITKNQHKNTIESKDQKPHPHHNQMMFSDCRLLCSASRLPKLYIRWISRPSQLACHTTSFRDAFSRVGKLSCLANKNQCYRSRGPGSLVDDRLALALDWNGGFFWETSFLVDWSLMLESVFFLDCLVRWALLVVYCGIWLCRRLKVLGGKIKLLVVCKLQGSQFKSELRRVVEVFCTFSPSMNCASEGQTKVVKEFAER